MKVNECGTSWLTIVTLGVSFFLKWEIGSHCIISSNPILINRYFVLVYCATYSGSADCKKVAEMTILS